MPVAKINPYNFVPFVDDKPKRTSWENLPKHHMLTNQLYSGFFDLTITTITPVFIPSPLRNEREIEKVNVRGGLKEKITFKKFCHRDSKPCIPGSSIKGMVRAVFEALTDSCMVLFAETYEGTTYPSDYKNQDCNTANGLCPACSVFGTISREDMAFQGKVQFTDAIGNEDDLEKGEWNLKELLNPKPERHPPFYAKDGKNPSSGPRGRKFYFHHNPSLVKNGYFTTNNPNHRNRKICQLLKKDSKLNGKVIFKGLTQNELACLIYALELDFTNKDGKSQRTMAHKIGMGKPLGLGSICIDITDGVIEEGTARYKSLSQSSSSDSVRTTINGLKESVAQAHNGLGDLLSLDKYKQGTILYPDLQWFNKNKNKKLSEMGEYEGTITKPWFPEATEAAIDFNKKINGTIKAIKDDLVIIEAENGTLYKRAKKVAQGIKKEEFHEGLKVVLSGRMFSKK